MRRDRLAWVLEDSGAPIVVTTSALAARLAGGVVEIVRLASGKLVKIDIGSLGTHEKPQLELSLSSDHVLSKTDVAEARRLVVGGWDWKTTCAPSMQRLRTTRCSQRASSTTSEQRGRAPSRCSTP